MHTEREKVAAEPESPPLKVIKTQCESSVAIILHTIRSAQLELSLQQQHSDLTKGREHSPREMPGAPTKHGISPFRHPKFTQSSQSWPHSTLTFPAKSKSFGYVKKSHRDYIQHLTQLHGGQIQVH